MKNKITYAVFISKEYDGIGFGHTGVLIKKDKKTYFVPDGMPSVMVRYNPVLISAY